MNIYTSHMKCTIKTGLFTKNHALKLLDFQQQTYPKQQGLYFEKHGIQIPARRFTFRSVYLFDISQPHTCHNTLASASQSVGNYKDAPPCLAQVTFIIQHCQGMVLCTMSSNADFCTWRSGYGPYFIVIIMKDFLTQYFVKYCSLSSSDWSTKSRSAYYLGRRVEGGTPVP